MGGGLLEWLGWNIGSVFLIGVVVLEGLGGERVGFEVLGGWWFGAGGCDPVGI